MRPAFLAVLLLAGGCDDGGKVARFDRAALDVAERVAPEATFTVTDSRSNMTRDSGRTVYLRYEDGTDSFPVLVSMYELNRCGLANGVSCEDGLRRQIVLGRQDGALARHLAPVLATCGAVAEGANVRVASQRRDLSDRSAIVTASPGLSLPARPLADDDPFALAQRCDALLRAAHASGPFPELALATTFSFTLEPAEAASEEARAWPVEARYDVRTTATGRTVALSGVGRFRDYDDERAFAKRLQAVAAAALDRANLPYRPNDDTMPVTFPLADDRARVAMHLIAYPLDAKPDEPSRWDHAVRVIHDLRDGSTVALCLVEDVRRPDRLLDIERLRGPCSRPLD